MPEEKLTRKERKEALITAALNRLVPGSIRSSFVRVAAGSLR